MTTPTPERRAELRALEKDATPRPWTEALPERKGADRLGLLVAATGPRQGIYAAAVKGAFPAADRSLIVAARNELPALLSALDEMESRIAAERERAAQIAEASTDVTTEASARKIADRIRKA